MSWRGRLRSEGNLWLSTEEAASSHVFRVLDVLGSGAVGTVYRARDLTSDRDLALKVISSEPDPVRLERFQREGRLTASLTHANILRVHCAGVLDGQPFLGYELIEGGQTLADVLEALGTRDLCALLRDIALGLGYAHARGIVHRDVKPSNILIDPEGRPHVGDFGLATAQGLERLTRTGGLVGTPSYMAPEQFDGATDPGVDVWALGVILYEGLTGELPFVGDSVVTLWNAIVSGKLEPPSQANPSTPPALEAICLKALRRQPEERYPDGAALAEDLERFLQGEPVQAAPSRSPRNRLLLALPVILLAAVWAALPAPSTPSRRASVDPTASVATTHPDAPPWWIDLSAEKRPALPLPRGLRFGAGRGEYLNEQDGSVLVWIPPGSFQRGGGPGAKRQTVHLSGFFIGKYEVSQRQFAAFQAAKAVRGHYLFTAEGNDLPVVMLTWDEAAAYCAWAGLQLPTEAQWEFAARGPKSHTYPWGEDPPDGTRVNGQGDADGYATLSPVGTFPGGVSPFGCLDMSGNVREWVQDWNGSWTSNPVTDPKGPPEGTLRLVRGSGHDAWKTLHACNHRVPRPPSHRGLVIGFRVCLVPRKPRDR